MKVRDVMLREPSVAFLGQNLKKVGRIMATVDWDSCVQATLVDCAAGCEPPVAAAALSFAPPLASGRARTFPIRMR